MWQAFGQRLKLPWDPKLCVEFAALLAIFLDPMLSPSLSKMTFDVNPGRMGQVSVHCGRLAEKDAQPSSLRLRPERLLRYAGSRVAMCPSC